LLSGGKGTIIFLLKPDGSSIHPFSKPDIPKSNSKFHSPFKFIQLDRKNWGFGCSGWGILDGKTKKLKESVKSNPPRI
jgi:hypothetical protein